MKRRLSSGSRPFGEPCKADDESPYARENEREGDHAEPRNEAGADRVAADSSHGSVTTTVSAVS